MSDLRVAVEPVRIVEADFVLRSFTDADVPALVAAFADPEIVEFNPGPAGDEDAVVEWFRHRNDWSSGSHNSWAIGAHDGTLLGSVSMFDLNAAQLCGEVGYWVAPAARGRGLATRAVDRVAMFAFDTLGLHRMYLHHAIENVGSCRVAAAAGFAPEGTLRQSWRHGTGEFHDEHLHARLATDELALRTG